ncbi:MAG TPA: hypothetical protein DEQ27_00765 [Prevotella sp.]|nr:hypothetical protein [Prevotella sp.]
MKKMFFAAIAAFAMVSVSSVFAMNAKYYNSPDGLANDTTADTTVTAPTAEPAPSTGSTAGDGMYIISDTTEVPTTTTDTPTTSTDTPAPADTTTSPATGNVAK